MSKVKNTGLDLQKEEAEQDGSEYKFGSTSPDCLYAVPTHLREQYLPWGELQFGREDFMDCATRDPLNTLELKFNYAYRNNLFKSENKKWLEDNGYRVFHKGIPYIEFSDRFNAIKSGTTRDGNSMKAPRQSIHKDGLIPKTMLPATSKMRWADYHNSKDITRDMEKLGKEFLTRWAINYEQYRISDLSTLLTRDLVGLAGFAWPNPVKGVYPKTDGPFNHAFMGFSFPLTRIYDNYVDTHDGDWIKQLASDYSFYPYGYRTFVSAEATVSDYQSWLQRAINLAKQILEGMMPPKSYDVPPEELPMNQEEPKAPAVSLQKELLELSNSLLKTNVRSGTAPMDLGCADALSSVLAKLLPFQNEISTARLNRTLLTDGRFERTLDLTPGNIIISPTDAYNVGHCGVILENGKIASNNSNSGLWDAHFSISTWVDRYRGQLNLPIYVYKLK